MVVTIDPATLKPDHRELIPNGYTPYITLRFGRGPGGRPTQVLIAVGLIGTDTTGEAVELHPGSGPRPGPAPSSMALLGRRWARRPDIGQNDDRWHALTREVGFGVSLAITREQRCFPW